MYNDLAIKVIEQINHNKKALVDLAEKIIKQDFDKIKDKFPFNYGEWGGIECIEINNGEIELLGSRHYRIQLLPIDELITLVNYLIEE